MKRPILASALCLLATTAAATPAFHAPGANLSYGQVSNIQSLTSFVGNPAAPAMALDRDNGRLGFGILSSVGLDLEIGDVPNLKTRMDDVSTKLDQVTNDVSVADDLKADLDDLLTVLGSQSYLLNVGLAAHAPAAPVVYISDKWGAFVLDVNGSVQARLGMLDGPVSLEFGSGFEPRTDSAIYLKAATVIENSLSYSYPVFRTGAGSLFAGVRGNLYMVGLGKAIFGAGQSDELESLLETELNRDRELQTGFGMDLGLMWTTSHFRAGATFKNINRPSFDYDAVGTECSALDGSSSDSCYIAQLHSDRIDLEETWVMDPQVRLEGAALSGSRNWFIGFALDANAVNDPLANQIQMASVSGGYATNSWLMPGFRLGVHKNLAGSQLTYATLGVTLFKVANLDLAYGLDSLKYDESQSLPRKLALNLGFELLF